MINNEIEKFTDTAAVLRRKLDKVEKELALQSVIAKEIEDQNK
jgi:hypothetical protein